MNEHSILINLYIELYGPLDKPGRLANLNELADTLSRLVGKEPAWTGIYLNNLIKGYKGFRITPELEKALNAMAGKLDGDPPLKALITKSVMVYSLNGLEEGSIVLAHSKQCPQCMVRFVPVVHNQKYCCPQCKGEYRKEHKLW